MNRLRVIGYELWRIMSAKKSLYILAGLSLFAFFSLRFHLYDGRDGTAPYSPKTFGHYLSGLNTFLQPLLILLCVPVFTTKELAVRRIVFATPISPQAYFLNKTLSIGAAFGAAAGILVALSLAFYAWEFRFFSLGEFVAPTLVFLVAPAVLLLGLSMALGQWNVKCLYALIPMVWFASSLVLGLPPWLDLAGNDYLIWHTKVVTRQGLIGGELPALLQPSFVWSRIGFVAVGLLLLAWACWSPGRSTRTA